jgi:hypothetical protein
MKRLQGPSQTDSLIFGEQDVGIMMLAIVVLMVDAEANCKH